MSYPKLTLSFSDRAAPPTVFDSHEIFLSISLLKFYLNKFNYFFSNLVIYNYISN